MCHALIPSFPRFLVTNFFVPETFYIKSVVSCSCSDMISCTLFFCLHNVLFVVALPIASRPLALRALYLEDAVYQPRKAFPLSPVSFKHRFFFLFSMDSLLCWAMQTENVHRRSDEPFWRKVPSRMTGNSSNFTDANRRVSQSGLRLSARGADRDRATMIEAVIGVSFTELTEGTNAWLCYTEAAILPLLKKAISIR